jgi:hypothetical protein
MKRLRTPARVPVLLGALVAALAVAQAARADLIPSDATVTGTGPFTFSYDFTVQGNTQIRTNDYIVIYDVKGFVPGSVTGPAGWTVSWQNTGPYPGGFMPPDDGTLPNIEWKYTGSTPITAMNTTQPMTGFSYQSTYGLIGQASYAAQMHDPLQHQPNRLTTSQGTVDVPMPDNGHQPPPTGDSPEPATLLLAGMGLAGVGLGALRKWQLRKSA